MSEDQNSPAPEAKRTADWSSDYFPTSARHVFLGWGAMVAGIIVLCFVAYATSEHSTDEKVIQKQETSRARLNELNVSDDE